MATEIYNLGLQEHFMNGLRADERMPVNAAALIQCEGLVPTPMGLALPEVITDVLSGMGFTVNHPYPHLHDGRRQSLILDDTAVYFYDPDGKTLDAYTAANICHNPNFTGSIADWSGTGWSASANTALHTPGTTNALVQTSANLNMPLVSGKKYKVTFTVTGCTAGSVNVNVGGTSGTVRSANGTYTEYLTAAGTGQVSFVPTSAFDGAIDSVVIYEAFQRVYDINDCIDTSGATEVVADNSFATGTPWTTGSGWSITGGQAVASGATSNDLVQLEADQSSALVRGKLYRISVDVAEVSAGNFRIGLGESFGPTIDETGVTTQDVLCYGHNSGSVLLTIDASGFTGKLNSISIKPIEQINLPNASGIWKVADFGDVWFAANDNVLVAKLPYYSDFRLVGIRKAQAAENNLSFPAIANYGQRLIMAMSSSVLFDPTGTSAEQVRWQEVWRYWREAGSEGVVTHENLEMDGRVLFYSTASGGVFDLPFAQEMAMLGFPVRAGAQEELEDAYLDITMKGEWGFVVLPWRKDVVLCKPLGNGYVVYCGDGISFVSMNQQYGGMSQIEIKDIGIAQAGSVTGDDRMHIIVDEKGTMWRLGADMQLQRLGYKEYIAPMLAETLAASYDSDFGHAYFTTGTTGYVYTGTGLGKLNAYVPTSLTRFGDELSGVVKSLGGTTFIVETLPFDMALDAQKILTQYGLVGLDITNLASYVKFRNNRTAGDSGFNSLTSVVANRSNVWKPNLPGRDFTIVWTGTVGTETKLERASVSYRLLEKKNFSGTLRAVTPF